MIFRLVYSEVFPRRRRLVLDQSCRFDPETLDSWYRNIHGISTSFNASRPWSSEQIDSRVIGRDVEIAQLLRLMYVSCNICSYLVVLCLLELQIRLCGEDQSIAADFVQ